MSDYDILEISRFSESWNWKMVANSAPAWVEWALKGLDDPYVCRIC